MELLDSLTVYHGTEAKYIELYRGDLSAIPKEHAADVLVVSAFPNDYTPTYTSLIGALDRKGVSVAQLARDKAVDLRDSFSCWMSREIVSENQDIQFKRILCFEPLVRGRPAEVVGDIFRSLMPFVFEDPPIKTIAMPVVATGDQRVPMSEILAPLLDAAVHWLMLGMPVTHIKIVQYSETRAMELKGAFAVLKQQYDQFTRNSLAQHSPGSSDFTYDCFISYAHEDADAVLRIEQELEQLRPGIRLFIDRKSLDAGVAWQQEIFEAIDDSHKVAAVYSPSYLQSKVCKEEFNIALFRHRHSDSGVLIPIYLRTAELPTYMQLIHYLDCRENDYDKLGVACPQIVANLEL